MNESSRFTVKRCSRPIHRLRNVNASRPFPRVRWLPSQPTSASLSGDMSPREKHTQRTLDGRDFSSHPGNTHGSTLSLRTFVRVRGTLLMDTTLPVRRANAINPSLVCPVVAPCGRRPLRRALILPLALGILFLGLSCARAQEDQTASRSALTSSERAALEFAADYKAGNVRSFNGEPDLTVAETICSRKCKICFDGLHCDFACARTHCLHPEH